MARTSLSSFGALLARYRRLQGLSCDEVGDAVGLSGLIIGTYETGERNPPDMRLIDGISAKLGLTSGEGELLREAARRDRVLVEEINTTPGQGPIDVNSEGAPRTTGAPVQRSDDVSDPPLPTGVTPEGRKAVEDFLRWRRRRLQHVMETSLTIVVWAPTTVMSGPIAEARREIAASLVALGHTLAPSVTGSSVGLATSDSASGVSIADPAPSAPTGLDRADLIIMLAEDDAAVVEELIMACHDSSLLPRVRAMIPRRYEHTVAADLGVLINGWSGVYWYGAADVANAALLREAVRRSEARRKVKAFSVSQEGVRG
jgi:transcriptional regulator with XRE-family HTH domain